MTDDVASRRRRAVFRAGHRGTKEMDWLLGRFAEAETGGEGALRTGAALTLPGFVHDVCSGAHPMGILSPLFRELREPQSAGACGSCGHYDSCRGGCMAAKFFTGLPLDGPDPECVQGHGAPALARERQMPRPRVDHSRAGPVSTPVPLTLSTRPPTLLCNESPV